jgi:hypothetical protein
VAHDRIDKVHFEVAARTELAPAISAIPRYESACFRVFSVSWRSFSGLIRSLSDLLERFDGF